MAEGLLQFAGVGLAFGLGLLIGVERGWSHRQDADGSRVAGIRTFALLGLVGGLAGEAASHVSPLIGAALLAAAAGALLIGYARAASGGEVSVTTTVVGVITLGVGVMAASGYMMLAAVVAAVTTLVLAQRRLLHAWLDRLNEAELQAIVRFALIALAILPLLPDRNLGPLGAWNPRQIWMVVVLVSGLSLVGYGVSKRLGAARGVLAVAAAGAIVSSTAVTVALAARIRHREGDEHGLVAGIAIASAVMFCRVIILVAVLAPFALGSLLVVATPAAAVSVGYVVWSARRPRAATAAAEPPGVRNPFDLGPAVLLAGVVMAASLAARWALQLFGDAGLAAVLGISGMVDVDAAIITMSNLPSGSLSGRTAGLIVAAPVLANTLLKAGLAVAVGRGAAGRRAAFPLLLGGGVGLLGAATLALAYGA